jgi:hypothetical protein
VVALVVGAYLLLKGPLLRPSLGTFSNVWVISEIPCTSADLASEGSNGLMSAVYTPNLAYTNDKHHNLTFLKS